MLRTARVPCLGQESDWKGMREWGGQRGTGQDVPGDRPSPKLSQADPLPCAQTACSREVAANTNRSGWFVGTRPGFLRDRMSCWEQPLCLFFLAFPFQALRLALFWPVLLLALLALSSLSCGAACSGGAWAGVRDQGLPGMSGWGGVCDPGAVRPWGRRDPGSRIPSAWGGQVPGQEPQGRDNHAPISSPPPVQRVRARRLRRPPSNGEDQALWHSSLAL